MNQPETANSVRYRLMERQRVYRHLLVFPEQQAEAIARHYAAHAQIAVSILRLLKLRRENEPIKDSDECIRMLVDQIKADHAKDFGIELDWQSKEL